MQNYRAGDKICIFGELLCILEPTQDRLTVFFKVSLEEHMPHGTPYLDVSLNASYALCSTSALGGFLHKVWPKLVLTMLSSIDQRSQVGLLPKDNQAQLPFAYRMYKRTDSAGLKLCAGFKETYCQTVQIEFMGVWSVIVRGIQFGCLTDFCRDTVSSVGVLAGRTLPYTNSNISIKTFRHALSLDEVG